MGEAFKGRVTIRLWANLAEEAGGNCNSAVEVQVQTGARWARRENIQPEEERKGAKQQAMIYRGRYNQPGAPKRLKGIAGVAGLAGLGW